MLPCKNCALGAQGVGVVYRALLRLGVPIRSFGNTKSQIARPNSSAGPFPWPCRAPAMLVPYQREVHPEGHQKCPGRWS